MPEVDLSVYKGREQAYVKHCLLENYLPELAYRVGKKWDALVYVDGFAGPWETQHPDYADSSFSTALRVLGKAQEGLRAQWKRDLLIESILIEENKSAFEKLNAFAVDQNRPRFGVHPLKGKFIDRISDINEIVSRNTQNAFRLVFLDPKGWADIPMESLKPFLKDRSCEVLITLMTRHIGRFLDLADRAGSYYKLFGREGVLEALQRTQPAERTEREVYEYSISLKELCGFKYVSSAVILEPEEESIRYFLVYATNHPRGVEVFKVAETKAARIQDDVRHRARIQKTGQLEFLSDDSPPRSRLIFELRQRYTTNARKRIKEILSMNTSQSGMLYEDLFCEAMSFPLVTADDLLGWLDDLKPHIKILLSGSGRRRRPLLLRNDRVVVVNKEGLRGVQSS